MQLGMVGLGRMGANMTRRLMRGGHQLVVSDLSADAVKQWPAKARSASSSLDDLVSKLTPRRAPPGSWFPRAVRPKQTVQTLRAAHAGRRHHHRRRQFLFQRRRPPRQRTQRQRHSLRRRRHQRRRLGTRARLLHDDRRSQRSRAAARSDFQDARARTRRHPAHSGPRKTAAAPPKTATSTAARRLRTLRQDGAQRHRVRHDAGLRRRLRHLQERHQQGICRKTSATI